MGKRRAGEEAEGGDRLFPRSAGELLETGADGDVVLAASRAVHDEVRHGEICRALASRYRGEDVLWPPAVSLEGCVAWRWRPWLRADPASRRGDVLRERGCFSDLPGRELRRSDGGLRARAALRELLRDEVEHARFGWIYVGRAVALASARAALQEHVLPIVRNVVSCWFDDSAITIRQGMPDDGLPSVAVMRACAVTAMRDLVLPGFERVGVDVSATRDWLKAIAS